MVAMMGMRVDAVSKMEDEKAGAIKRLEMEFDKRRAEIEAEYASKEADACAGASPAAAD